ncbi:MAG TPA: CDP-diacylglycerol--glycerol-3-phosphate 3-phosphatidyltransferase [Pirellulaceae bacterium]
MPREKTPRPTEAPSAPAGDSSVWNIPNRITMARLFLSLLVFCALHVESYGWAAILFVVAVGTDFVDGYLARRWNQVSQFGRIVDPLADKVVICGVYIFLAARSDSLVAPWMAVVVMVRELVVTVIRSFLEQHGRDFSATWAGKLKMVLQSVAAVASLWLTHGYASGTAVPRWLPSFTQGALWIAIAMTIYSGAMYIPAALRLFSQVGDPGEGANGQA